MHHDDEKSGFIFLMALFVLTSLASVVATGLSRSFTEQLSARTDVQKAQAFHLAEAGVDDVLRQLPTLTPQQLNDLLCNHNAACPLVPRPLNPLAAPIANYTVIVTDNVDEPLPDNPNVDTDRLVVATARGTSGAVTQTVRINVRFVSSGTPLGVFGASLFQIQIPSSNGTVIVDSYNSEENPYPLTPFAERSNAVVGTNDPRYDGMADIVPPPPADQTPDDLRILESPLIGERTEVHGRALISPLVDPASEVVLSGSVNPTLEVMPGPLEMPPVDLPDAIEHDLTNPRPDLVPDDLEALCGASPPALTVAAPPTVVISINSCFEKLNVFGTGQVVLNPGVKIYLKGDGDPTHYVLQMGWDEGRIIAKGQNEIYGGLGHISVRSRWGFINDSALIDPRPKELIIRLEGSHDSALNYLRQEAPFYGAVYIRRGAMWVKGNKPGTNPYTNGEYFGAVISGDALALGAHDAGRWLRFHHDTSLSYEEIVLKRTGPPAVNILLWQQIP